MKRDAVAPKRLARRDYARHKGVDIVAHRRAACLQITERGDRVFMRPLCVALQGHAAASSAQGSGEALGIAWRDDLVRGPVQEQHGGRVATRKVHRLSEVEVWRRV